MENTQQPRVASDPEAHRANNGPSSDGGCARGVYRLATILMLAFAISFGSAQHAFADDLDDGISDGDINNSDELKKDVNICYIKRSAKAKGNRGKNAAAGTSEGGDIVQQGIVIKDGAVVDGPVTLITEGGQNTAVNER